MARTLKYNCLFCCFFHNFGVIAVWKVRLKWQTMIKNSHFSINSWLYVAISTDRKGLQVWFTYHFLGNLISFNMISKLYYFVYRNIWKKMKMLPLPLNFTDVCKKSRPPLKWMVHKNDRSYILENLIVFTCNHIL